MRCEQKWGLNFQVCLIREVCVGGCFSLPPFLVPLAEVGSIEDLVSEGQHPRKE